MKSQDVYSTKIDYHPTYERLRSCPRLQSIDDVPKAGIQARGKDFHIQISPIGTVIITYENEEALEEAKSILVEYAKIELKLEKWNPPYDKMRETYEKFEGGYLKQSDGPVSVANERLKLDRKAVIQDDEWNNDLDLAIKILGGWRKKEHRRMADILEMLKHEPSNRLNIKKAAQYLGIREKDFVRSCWNIKERGIRIGIGKEEIFILPPGQERIENTKRREIFTLMMVKKFLEKLEGIIQEPSTQKYQEQDLHHIAVDSPKKWSFRDMISLDLRVLIVLGVFVLVDVLDFFNVKVITDPIFWGTFGFSFAWWIYGEVDS